MTSAPGVPGSKHLAVLGGGNMGEALIRGVIDAGWASAADVMVAETVEARRAHLSETLSIDVVAHAREAAEAAPVVVLAVKPEDVPAVLADIAGPIDRDGLLISIAAGIPLSVLEHGVGPGIPVVRVMPNTPALIREGVAALAPGQHADDAHLDTAEGVLGAVGHVVRVSE